MLNKFYKKIVSRKKVAELQNSYHKFNDEELIKLYFSESFYLETYKDVAEAGIDAFEHYMNYGWKEMRDPSPVFNTSFYLLEHEDVSKSNINPLKHYALWGRNENRKIKYSNSVNRPLETPSGLYEDSYFEQFSTASGGRSPLYAPIMQRNVNIAERDTRFIAFYLPQFHPFEENNNWWGKGFTEWTNVSKATPQFSGHYQPRLPGELGFYDLRLTSNMHRQVELAKKYGVSAFCFHYYWFDGKKLMDEPIDNYLNDSSIDFPFCLCWANENWTRRWDGAEHDVLIGQNHSDEDNIAVFYDLLRYFKDSRYVTVNGKPMIVLYRPAIIPNVEKLVATWRELAVENGLSGLHIVATNAFGFDDFRSINFDAIVEFPPHGVVVNNIKDTLKLLNNNYKGNVYDYSETVDFCLDRLNTSVSKSISNNYYPCVMTGWDNEARKPGNGNVFFNATPLEFNRWLKGVDEWSKKNHTSDENFVFINAWNEWAEGTYLEPDRKFGYAYLNAISNVRESNIDFREIKRITDKHNSSMNKQGLNAVYIHIFYEDMLDEINSAVHDIRKKHNLDIIISVPHIWSVGSVKKAIKVIKPNLIYVFNNKGRDILPFIKTIKEINNLNYNWICKLHSKKSPHMNNGKLWREQLFQSLLSDNIVSQTLSLSPSSKFGIVAPVHSVHYTNEFNTMLHTLEACKKVIAEKQIREEHFTDFIGGTMFWFHFPTMKNIIAEDLIPEDLFEEDLGAIDGTFAHTTERLFSTLFKQKGMLPFYFECENDFNPYK
ncbi:MULTISPECIES: glycoside hydrolase family 99-like domain-containing protein [Leclercia]|uniref:glycoside hydrolase family 99-like domain-containing protein n=1 Tax=Leclercia TaxID=83654 RepID=UPI0012E95040|nr:MULTISPECIES: glycoside hydrolase family 99-like domain-containing protein [Leclercia]QGW15582.1 hypothetical protein GNG29_03135 [Leclercia sp. Colony189]URM23548.1 glycoside hydrolase family 99-like domain-containing protein [Leclercia adecarboxylata]